MWSLSSGMVAAASDTRIATISSGGIIHFMGSFDARPTILSALDFTKVRDWTIQPGESKVLITLDCPDRCAA